MTRRTLFAFGCIFCVGSGASAQQVTVQQPVTSVFGVSTTISVPDRGSAVLGGVSSAASGRSVYGPIPSGRNSGFQASASTTEARVWIHDASATDAAILKQAESQLGQLSQLQRTEAARHILQGRSGSATSAQFPAVRARSLQILRDRR